MVDSTIRETPVRRLFTTAEEDVMRGKLTLDLNALKVASFEAGAPANNSAAGPSALTAIGCCPSPSNCNTYNTCSSNYC